MAERYSTGAIEALTGKGKDHFFIGTDISFTAASKKINSVTDRFSLDTKPGDKITVLGSGFNDGKYTVVSVTNAKEVVVAEALINESASAKLAVVCQSQGGTFPEVFANACGAFYTGTQPASADAAETGTLLGYLTVDGAAFTPGNSANGINWNDSVDGVITKKTGIVLQCVPIASGTVGYFRLYDNTRVTGLSTTAVRLDLACGVGVGEVRLSSTTFTMSVPVTLNTFTGTATKTPV